MKSKIDTILIIEDDLGLIELINDKVQECGQPTICFQTAATAFEWLENNTPILMMLDYSLPDMNAQEFIAELKRRNRTIAPFLVATGRGDEKIAVEMMKLGAKEYIIKDTLFLEMIPLVVCKSIAEIEKDNKLLLTEQKFIELSQFNKQIIENAHEGIIVYDKELNYLSWNPFMKKITGYSAVDIIGKNAIELFPFLHEAGEAANIRKAIDEKTIIENEFKFDIPSTGKFGWARQTSGPLYNFEGEVIGAISTVHDVTKRKEAEKILELTKQSYVDIINTVSEAIYVMDENAVFIRVNKGARDMYQLSDEELVGKTPADLAAPGLNDLEQVQKQLLSVFKTGIATTFEFWAVRKNGEIFPKEILVNKGRYFEKDVLIATARDITERKAAQYEIDKIGKHYQALIENAPDGIVLINAEGQFLYASPSARKVFGYNTTEELSTHPNDLTHPDDLEYVLQNIDKTLENPAFVPTIEYRFRDKAGSWKWVETTFTNLLGDSIVSAIVLNFKEITERKNNEEALKQSEEKYRHITENISDVVWIMDLQFRLSYVSTSVEKILNESVEKIIKSNLLEIFPPEYIENFEVLLVQELEKELAPNSDPHRTLTLELEIYKADGSRLWVESNIAFLRNAEGQPIGIQGSARDISERKKAQNALKLSEEKYRHITENITDVVWTSDLQFNLNFISSSIEKMCGETAEEHMFRTPNEKFKPESWSRILTEFNLELENEKDPSIKKDRIHSIEVEHIKANGSVFWAEMRMTFLRDENSKAIGLLGITQDISERRKFEDQINKLNNCFIGFGSDYLQNINSLVKVSGELTNASCAMYNRLEDNKLFPIGCWNLPTLSSKLALPEESICYDVIHSEDDKPLIIHELQQSKYAQAESFISKYLLDTYIGKPVKLQDIKIGLLCAAFQQEYNPSKNEIHLLEIIASAIGVEEERMQAQKAVEVSEEKYRTMIEYSNDWIWMLDKNACFTFFNKTAEDATELNAKDWIGKPFTPLVMEEDLDMLTDVFKRSINGEICSYELRFRKTDLSILTILVNTSPIYVQGVIIGMISFGQDITERKKAENDIIKNEALLKKALIESSGMIQSNDNEIDYQRIANSVLEISDAKMLVFMLSDNDGQDYKTVALAGEKENLLKVTSILGFDIINRRWQKNSFIVDIMKDKTIAIFNSIRDLTKDRLPKPISFLLEKTFNIGETAVVKITRNDTLIGYLTLVYSKGQTLQNSELIELFANQVGLFIERKKAEKALTEGEAIYSNLVQRIPDGVYKSTPSGKFVDVNPAMVKMFGYDSKDDLLKIDIKKELYLDASHRDPIYLNPLNEEKAVFQLRKKDGSGIWVEDHGWYTFDKNGIKISNEGVMRDITERKKAEDELIDKMDELMRFHRLTVDRELTMIELKREINDLMKKAGQDKKYNIVE